jgi:hypothetical protein
MTRLFWVFLLASGPEATGSHCATSHPKTYPAAPQNCTLYSAQKVISGSPQIHPEYKSHHQKVNFILLRHILQQLPVLHLFFVVLTAPLFALTLWLDGINNSNNSNMLSSALTL